jgi:putative DNA primase/helicase
MSGYYYRQPPARDRPRTAEDAREAAEKQRRALEIWRSCKVPNGSPGERYLRSRGIMPDVLLYPEGSDGWPATIGWADDVYLSPKPPTAPGLVFAVNDSKTGLVAAVHRVVFRGGEPIREPNGKRRKISLGPIVGNFFCDMLAPDPLGRWGLAEGCESALAATQLVRFPVYAAVSAGNMAHISPPTWTTDIVVFADHDADGTGQTAAARAFRALRQRYPRGAVRLLLPRAVGADANDVLKEAIYAPS